MTRVRTLHLALGWTAMAGLGLGLMVWPRLSVIREQEGKKATLSTMINTSDDVNSQIMSLATWMRSLEEEVHASTTPIPEQGDVAGLVRDLAARLTELGVYDREITTGAAVDGEDAASLPMTVTMRGDFQAIFDAVRWLEGLPRLVRVRRLRIERLGLWTHGMDAVSADLVMDVFFEPSDLSKQVDEVLKAAAADPVREGGR